MKRICLCVGASVLISVVSTVNAAEPPAKEVSIQTDIESLQAPSSPAFGILDLNPSAIARPTSPKEFRTSLLSSIAESESAIPGNLALEVTPYWWTSRSKVTFKDLFVNPKRSLTIKQSLSYSIASVTRNASSETESTDVAFGLRFSVLPGKLSKKSKQLNEQVEITSKALVAAWRTDACKLAIKKDDPALKTANCPADNSAVATAATKSVDSFKASLSRRTGLQLDVASAVAYNIASNDTSSRDFKKGGLWVTAAYTPESDSVGGYQYLGIARYLQEKNAMTDDNDDSFDVGLWLIWRHSEQPVALSLEYINRIRDEGSDAERYAGILEYRINDTLSLTSSIGKNFKEEGTDDDFFVLGGVSFNFGKGPQVMFDTGG